MILEHKSLGSRVRIDFSSGIYVEHFSKSNISWDSIAAIIGYKSTGIYKVKYNILLAIQENNADIFSGILFSTTNEWEYRYFIEKIVKYLKDKYGAYGGLAWCARTLDKNGQLIKNGDAYKSYVLCRILADTKRIRWFDHTQGEEVIVAFTFIEKRLVKDGTELKQLLRALEETKFVIQENGKIDLWQSTGYRILDDERIKYSSEKAK